MRFFEKRTNQENECGDGSLSIRSHEELRDYLHTAFFGTDDLVIDLIERNDEIMALIQLATLTDLEKVDEQILSPLNRNHDRLFLNAIKPAKMQELYAPEQVVEALTRGNCVVYIEGYPCFYSFNTSIMVQRSIAEPINEKAFSDSHEGFNERLETNLYLLRRKMPTKNLVLRYFEVGQSVNSRVAVVFVGQLANQEVVDEVEMRIRSLRIDYVSSAGVLDQMIEDTPFSPFPQILSTERVDRVSANLMEGRIAVMVEGSSNVLILPVTFFAFYQSPDDYNIRWINGSFFRFLRMASFFLAITLPAIYISVVSFHFETIPSELVLPMQVAVMHIPFPPIIEAIVMELTIELLREAGLRLHTAVGQTIGIVGGLVIGDAIVRAGFVSNVMIIVVASTAIASFVVPSHDFRETVRILRFPMMILAATFGFLGITFGFSFLLIHLCKLEGFGVPYFYPFSPFRLNSLQDSFVRLPIWSMNRRPMDSRPQKRIREFFSRGWVKDEHPKR
ncbi:spore germination protein [Brevibacillus fluminis]|uniref:Spore germination protein n=1 Tax=Brevibacillus fluminis TaxID=511487 RepID=A0A3M8DAK4_9BACL|nr:spore germination protein [Brevibacillus fluminis]RNB84619.1 spore germination protein [Brevibacillus fluminis]